MLSVFARLSVVTAILIFLGVVAIFMGFSVKWPNAQVCGAIFFIGGWLLAGLVSIGSVLDRILAVLSQKDSQQDPDQD